MKKFLLIGLIFVGAQFIGAQDVHAVACTLGVNPNSGSSGTTATINWRVLDPDSQVDGYVDFGNGDSDSDGGFKNAGRYVDTVYSGSPGSSFNIELWGSSDEDSCYSAKTFNISGGGGGGQLKQCEDGVDNDSDNYTDYPNDCGCSEPTDTSEGGGCQNPVAWVNLDITTEPDGMRWGLFCPSGPYTCNFAQGTGTQYIINPNSYCNNGQCAGAGTYSILGQFGTNILNPGYDCVGNSDYRVGEPGTQDIVLALNCTPVATPTPTSTPTPTATPTSTPDPTDNSVCVSHTIPSAMTVNETRSVSMTFRNTGTSTWTQSSPANYDISLWPWPASSPSILPQFMDIANATVAPNGTTTSVFNLTAPSVAGSYSGQYRVLHQGINWFGATCGPASIDVSVAPNTNPTVSNVRLTEPDYCALGPGGTVSWTYSDADPQSSYQLQVDTNAGFSSPDVDKTVVSSVTNTTVSNLAFNTRYYTRVRATDSQGGISSWTTMSLCTGPGCAGNQQSWQTPIHGYPNSLNFSWTPTNPLANQVVTFDKSTTTCYNSANNPVACASYTWNWADGSPSEAGPNPTPTHTFATSNTYLVTLRATDSEGYTCPATSFQKAVIIGKPVPSWKEVIPR